MVSKVINGTDARPGTSIMIEGVPFVVKKMDVSKTGKHGHAKARIEAVGIINPAKRKVFVIPGHDKLDVPNVDKRKGQILSISEKKISLMDLENFETIEVECNDEELLPTLTENENVEYWDVEGSKLIKRAL
jgi:translation initiation factor 5A